MDPPINRHLFLQEFKDRTGIDFFTDAGFDEGDLMRWSTAGGTARECVTECIYKYDLDDCDP